MLHQWRKERSEPLFSLDACGHGDHNITSLADCVTKFLRSKVPLFPSIYQAFGTAILGLLFCVGGVLHMLFSVSGLRDRFALSFLWRGQPLRNSELMQSMNGAVTSALARSLKGLWVSPRINRSTHSGGRWRWQVAARSTLRRCGALGVSGSFK